MPEKTVKYREWVRRGTMMVNASALEIDDPDHVYNQIKAQGVNPEDYGFYHPYAELYADKSREQLIAENIKLKKDLEVAYSMI